MEQRHQALALWAADCAERVLAQFESTRPDDARPREAVEAARAWARGDIPTSAARSAAFAAHAAARETSTSTAAAAARSAGHAAATAHVATHAPHAAAYALKAVGAGTDMAVTREKKWQDLSASPAP